MNNILKFLKEKNIPFYCSLISSIGLCVFHLIILFIVFSWFNFTYMVVCLLMFACKILLHKNKKNFKNLCRTSIFFSFLLLLPIGGLTIFVILFRKIPVFIFDFMIYGYALYAVIKLSTGIIAALKNKENKKSYEYFYSNFSIISALVTIMMLEVALINTFSENSNLNSLLILEIISHVFLVFYIIFISANFAIIYHKNR